MQGRRADDTGIRLAEVIAALSLATDLGRSQPMEHHLRSCLLAVRLGDEVGLDEAQLSDVYYTALLRNLGCTSYAHEMAALVGNELALMSAFDGYDIASQSETAGKWLAFVRARQAYEGASFLSLARWIAMGITTMPVELKKNYASHCEVAEGLARGMGFGESVLTALTQAFERWDGRGLPAGVKGEAIALPTRIVALADDMTVFHRAGGVEAAIRVARERAGGAYDPRLVERFLPRADALLAGIAEQPSWEFVLAAEPGSRPPLSGDRLDAALRAAADFADIKSPYTLSHSERVAELATRSAGRYGLSEADTADLRRAAWVHELGRAAITNAILDKPGPLTEIEWERVRLHPYYTERVMANSPALARWGWLGATHHERLNGAGYHRGARAADLPPAARLLAAANRFCSLTEARAYRPALAAQPASDELLREVRSGRLEGEAVNAVLASAGQRALRQPARVAGLTDREVEVLRLLAASMTTRQIAQALSISEKTADHHIQHIYTKIGVSTRAGAALFAMQHDMIGDWR